MTVQLRVGTTASAPRDLAEKLTIAGIESHVKEHFPDYTLIPARGAYGGEHEESAIVELFFVTGPKTGAGEVYKWCTNVHNLIKNLLRNFAQRAIIAFVTISSSDREIQWSVLSKLEDELKDPPFPWIALLVRHLVGGNKLGLEHLHGLVQQHFKRLDVAGPRGFYFNDLPAVGIRAPAQKSLMFDGASINTMACMDWDEGILVKGSGADVNSSVWEDCANMGEFLSRFRSVSSNAAYYVANISALRGQNFFNQLEVEVCPYNIGIGCCEGYYLKIVGAWLSAGQVETDAKKYLNQECDIERLNSLAFPLLGLSVVTITPQNEVLIKKRGTRVGAYPDAYHVVPSCIVEPFHGLTKPSIAYTFLRELDEEMFQAPEAQPSLEWILGKKHIRELKGELRFLGYALDLMHGDVNVLAAFHVNEDWWRDYGNIIRLNWEYAGSVPEFELLHDLSARATRSPSDFVPAAVVALNFLKSETTSKVGSPIRI